MCLSGDEARAEEPAQVGPQTENRFPPLQTPAGFKATLFACDPLIEYPSVISVGPRPGAVFMAVDYMTGLGTEIVRRSEVRLVEDTDGDGYADKSSLFAGEFNSIEGMAWQDGVMYVMHAPFLTRLHDTQGDGVADDRRDLLSGLGLTPEQNPVRLHCANGVAIGHDGWLYLALGDNGVDIARPEGDRLVLQGGGILRCRPDGRDLHVFSRGLRNIYDVALDAELNVFTRDNENDGGTYKIRVCHSFFGADHGYPYLYYERPDEALPPLADLGLGSSAGVTCYLERQFPEEYRGDLFSCEWGRSLARYPLDREGSSFARHGETEFAAGAANDPYGFKPTDVVVQSDGTLMVSDWADGQRPKRGRGRIYQLAYVGDGGPAPQPDPEAPATDINGLLAQLDSDSYAVRRQAQSAIERRGRDGLTAIVGALNQDRIGTRGRLHAIWIVVHFQGSKAIEDLLRMAQSDPEVSVRAQAVRAIADLSDPVLIQNRLDAGPGDSDLAARLAAIGKGQKPQVLLEVIIALGRLQWSGAPDWLKQIAIEPDAALSHAAMQTMRRAGAWPAVLALLDATDAEPIRAIALRAIAQQSEPAVVDGLIERLAAETAVARRSEYADALTRVHRRPGTWVYWGYRPGPRPANTLAWDRSEAIALALDGVLTDPDRGLRLSVLQRMQREKAPVLAATLGRWLDDEREPSRVSAILTSLAELPSVEIRPLLESIARDAEHSSENRLAALNLLLKDPSEATGESLLALAASLEEGPVLAEALRRTSNYTNQTIAPLLASKLHSPEPAVRAAAIEALGELRAVEGRELLPALLDDIESQVRLAAAVAAGKMEERRAIEPLLQLVVDGDPSVRRASLNSLRLLREPRAIPLAVAALADHQVALTALECVGELGGPEQAGAIAELAKHSPSVDVLSAAVRVLSAWRDRTELTAEQRQELDRAVADIQGVNGVLLRWTASLPVSAVDAAQSIQGLASAGAEVDLTGWRTLFASGVEARVPLAPQDSAKGGLLLAYADLTVAEPAAVEFLASSSGSFHVWLNGQPVFERQAAQAFTIDSDRFAATLAKGANRLLVQVGAADSAAEFHLRFRRKSDKVEHERLTQAALARAGNPRRGEEVFLQLEKSLCLKCHRLGERGERAGPELTGVGGRFSRIYLVEAILEPSRAIAPSFGTLSVALADGKALSGVKIAETETSITLADNLGQKRVLEKSNIDEQARSPLSTMPEGLEKRFTEDEFVDLIAFLAGSKETRPP